jgi:hypothetical protein
MDDASVAATVPKSAKERILGGIGGVLSAGAGKSPDQSPLVQAMQKEHQQHIDIAQKHYKDFQTYTGILATGIDPDTGKPLTAEAAEKYYTLREQAGAGLEKTAGVNKDIKAKLQKVRMLADHIIKTHPKPGQQGGAKVTPDDDAQGGAGGAGGGGGGQGGPGQVAPPPKGPSKVQELEQGADADRTRQAVGDQRDFTNWQRRQEVLKNYKIEEEEAKAKADALAKSQNPSTRAVMGPAISVRNARDLAMQGKSFNDIDGNPIDLTSMPDSMGLKNVIHGGKSYFEPFSPNSKVITAGNETYAVSPMDVEAISPKAGEKPAGTDLGQHRVGTSSASEQGIDPTTGTTKTNRVTTPQTPGAAGRVAPPPTNGAAAGAGAGGSNLMPTNATAMRITPVREAMTQLFGDPSQPAFKGLKDYGGLADNPESAKKIGSAVQLVLNGISEEEKRSGSLANLLKNYAGIPQALIQSQLAINKDVIGKLSPKEQEAFNTVISSYSTVMGLRALTKASSAQFSVKALERDVPVPGMNVFSKRAFDNKMARLAEEVYTGSRTVPGLTAQERTYINQQVKEFSTGSSSKSSTSPPPKLGDKMSIDDEIKQAVKDAAKPN